jgi:hypothetical protein
MAGNSHLACETNAYEGSLGTSIGSSSQSLSIQHLSADSSWINIGD